MPLSDYPSTLGKGVYTHLTASASPQAVSAYWSCRSLHTARLTARLLSTSYTFEADCERI